MPRDARKTRNHILNCGYELFYRMGFNRVGVDDIAAAAGVTKRTLYYHFDSKDALLEAALELHHQLALARIRKYEHRYTGSAEDIVSLLFAELAKWSKTPNWTGAGFTRLAMELADLSGHPARTVARRHKQAVEAWYTELLSKAGVPSPVERARELAVLAEGATSLILVHGDRSYAEVAARAAKQLVRDVEPTKNRQDVKALSHRVVKRKKIR
jgi:AcrR family transcriptional regulator